MSDKDHTLKNQLRDLAAAAGFDVVGFAPARLADVHCDNLDRYIKADHHGAMGWMEETQERRSQPQNLWPDVKSVITLGMSYAPSSDPLATHHDPDVGTISVYARNRDYHDLVKKRLKQVARDMVATWPNQLKVFVDTAPVMEKPLAAASGLGWLGKQTSLVSRQFGCWLFLGEIYTTLEITPDEVEADHCGSCSRCITACPTEAFVGVRQIDARRCISYLTIEHDGPIPRELRPNFDNRIYGCDDCHAVCPWNKFAPACTTEHYIARPDLIAPKLGDFLAMDDAEFRSFFSGSPVKRIKRRRFLRNVLIAVGNSKNPNYVVQVEKLLQDEDALIRGAAVWALSCITDQATFNDMRTRALPDETDPDVRAEWELG